MIVVQLVLKVGRMKHGMFESYDEYDLENLDEESVSDILHTVADPISDRAVLLLHVTGWRDEGQTICSFKRIKLKGKEGSDKYKWVVVE